MDFDMRNDFLALLENFHEHDASKIAFAFESPVNENYAIQRLIDFYSNQQNSKEIYGITMPKLDDINSPRGIRFNYLDLGGVGDCGARAFLAGTGLEFSVDTIYDIITKIYGKGFSKYDKEGNYTWLCDDHISYLCYLTGYNCLIEAVSPYNQEEVLLTMDFGFKRDLRFKHVHGVHWVVYPNISCDWDYYFTSLLFLGFIVKSRHESVEKYLLHDGITLNFIELFRAFSPILNNNDILNKLDFYIKKTEKEISDIKSSLGDDLPNRLSLHNMLMQYMSENQLDYIKINHKVLEDIKENYFYIEDCIDKMIISLEPGQKLMLSDTLEELVNSISDSFDLYKRYILLKSFNKYLNIDNLDFFVPRPDEVVASILNDSGLNLWEKWIESSTTLSKSLFSMETFIQRMVIKPKVQDIVDILHMYSNKIQKSVFGEIYDVRKIFVEEQSVYKASTSLKENLKKLNKLKNIAAIPFNLNTSLNFGAVIEDCEEIYYINEITRELILFILDLIHEEFTANVMEKQLDQDLQELEIGFIKKDILIPDAFEDDNTIFKQTPVNDENPEEKITDSDEREKERIESEHEEEGETEEEKIEETEEEEEEEEVEEEAAGEEEKELTDKEKEDSEEDEEEGDSEEDFSYTPCFNELSQVVIQPVKDFLKIIVDSYTARKSAGKAFNSWVKWGDISTSEEEEDFEKQGTDSERDYISEDERILQLESDEEKTHKEDNHVCWTAFCNGNVVWDKLPMLYENNKLRIINDDNFNCLIKTFDELQSVLNFYMDDFLTDKLKHNSVYYLKALENYFHFRHDIFATCFQMASKQLAPITVFGTDYSFKKYGLKSKKTPDLIYQKDNKTIFIIEFSVSSDVKKSAYQKGNTLERSKYIKEIEELKEKEYTVYWIPAYLSSSDWHDNSSDFMETLTKGGIFFLHDVYKMYLEIWKNMTPNLRMLDRIGYLVIGPDQLKLPKWMTKNSEDLLNVILSKGVYKGIDTAEHVMSVNSDLHKHVLIDIDNLISRLCYDKENYIRLIFEKRKIRMLRRDETVNKSKKQKASTLVNYLLNENFYEFYKYVDIYQGGVYHSCINYQPCILIKGTKDEKKIVNNNDHEECKVPEIAADIEKINLTKNTITLKMSEPWHFDYDDYEKMIELAQSNANLLGNCTISDEVVKSAVKQLQEEQKIKDGDMISAPKQPLTLPLFDTDSFVYQPINELDSSMVGLINKLGSDLLSKIVNLWVNKKFKKKIDLPAELYQERDAAQKEYINNCRKLGVQHIKKFSEMKKGEHGEILKPFMKNIYNVSEKIRNWYKKNKEMLESEDGSKNKAYIVTPYSKKSLKSFMRDKNELMWRDKNKIDIQRKMVDDVAAILFCEEVMQYLDSSNETDLDVLNKVLEHGADTESMILLKNVMMEKHKIALEEFMKKRVFVVCEFISRLMYTLCYMSNKKTNSNDFLVSNLSVKNCFLAVKGGLKMTKNKQSRIFRIVYKAPNFMAKHNVFPSHKPHIIEHYGECFYDSGWSVLDEKVVTEKISCVWQAASIFCNHAVRLKDIVPSTEKTPYKNLMFMFLIMLNNRRSTESALGNLRYLLVNTLGSHSAIKVLLPDFAFVTRDAVQRYIICNLIKNYYNYYVQVQNAVKVKFENTSVINPFNNGKIYGVDDFTSLLYCNFIMTKAPYNQPLEQAHNLESMMAIHQEYEQKCEGAKDIDSVLLHTSLCDDADMWSNDFYFDKEYCFKLGEYAADHLRANQMLPEIHSKWNSILSKSYLDVTTESGMRGEQIDKGKSGFFGKKGHEVVMTELLEDLINKKLVTQFMDIFNSNDTTQKKALNINNLDINYINKIQDLEEPQLKFHVVDKTQWKGSREIYVMSLYTKILQQPLEQFFGFLCKKTSNEMISIPSNKRISHIHSLIFENVHAKNINYEKIFLTLDCRKWGPKSNFTKYAYFILGMSNALPKDLIDYFLCMVLLYYKKQIYVSSRAWNVFKNNKKNKNFLDYFTIVEKLDTAYFTMPYSFVMGIFNYLSSLLHAYNQQFACSEINAHMRKKYDIDLFVNMVAHSDDSAGCIYFPTNRSLKDTKSKIIKEVLYLYEYHLKMANHCLSVKKCLVSPVYFEFISILYIKNELVPLTSKFYGLSLKPTIQGYSADMSQGYSKCIEMLTMGSTLSEAYFSMRLYSEMLRRMYHIKDYPDRPLSAFGGLYAHPILVLLVGAMADCVRLYRTDNKKFNQYQAICKTISGSSLDIFQQVGFVYTTFNVERLAIKNIRDNIEKLYGAALQNEILKNCEVKNSVVYPICFYNKLNSADFIASLNYTDNTRRINQLYYAASSDSIKSVLGLLSIKEVIQLIETCYVDLNDTGKCKYKFSDYVMEEITNTDVEKMDKIYQVNLGDANIVYEYLTSGVDEKVRIEWDKRTCKPIQIQMNLNDKQVDIKYDPSVIFYSDHPDFYLLGVNVDLTYEKQMLIKIMHDMGIDANNFSDFVYHARKLSKAYRVDINGYGYVHGENRFIRDFSGLVKYIESNSIPNHKITRIYNNFVHKYGQAQTFKRLPIIVEKFFKIYKFLLFLEKNISTGDLCKISLVNPNTGDKHSITNFRKVLDSMPSMLNITINTENMLKKEDCADAEFYYTWMKPQKRIGNKWVGSGILVFKVGKIFLRLHLHNNNVSSADFLGDWDRLVDSDLEMVKIVLDYSDITYMSRSPYPTQDYKLGIKNDMLVVDHEERLKAVICTVTEAEKNFAFSLKGSCQPSNKIGQYLTRSGQKIETLLSTFHYNLAEIKGYFFCGDKSIASNLIKSFMVEQPGDIEFDALDIADNFYNSKIYESMVYGKLRRSDYNVRDIIKNYCQDRNITYFDLSMAELHVILELNLDPNLLPLSIQELIKTKIVEENIVNCSEEFWTEYKKCCLKEIKGEEADWGNFLSDWALTKDQVLQLIKTKKGMLEEILINPIMFLEAYPDMCLETAKTITKALDACLNSGYNIHAHDEHHQIFRSLPDLTPSMLYELTFLISMNARFNSIDVNLPSLYITEIFRIIFNNSYLFHIFNKNVENDPLLHFTMIKSDDYRRWSKMYCVFCKVRKELYTERYRNLGDVFKEEQAYGTGLSTETGVYTPGVNKYRPGLGVTNNFTETFQIVNIYPKSVNVIEFQPKKFEKVHYTIPVQQFSNHYDWRKLIEVAGNIDFADDDWEGEDLEMELKDLLYEVKMEYEGTAESAEENSSYSEQIIEMLEIPSFKHNPAKNVQLNYNSKMDSIKMHRMKYPNYRRDTINYKKWNVPLYYLDGEWDMEDLMIQSPEFAIITPSIPCNINLFTGFNDMKFYINPKAKSKGNSFLVTYNLHPLADLDNSSLIKIPNSKILELLLNVENYYKNIFIKENKTVIKANLDHEEYRRLKNHLVDAVRTVEQVRKIKEESGLKNMSEIINNLQKDLPDDWWMDYYEDVKKFDIKFVDLLPEKEEPELISFMDIFDSHNAIQNAKSEEEKVFLTELEKVATFKSKIRRNVFKLANVRCEMIFWKWDENIPLSDDDKNFIDFLQRVSYNLDLKRLYEMTADTLPGIRAFILKNRLPRMSMKDLLSGMDLRFIIGASNVDMQEKILKAKVDKTTSESLYGRKFRHEDYNTFSPIDKGEIFYKEMEALFKENTDYFINNGMILTRSAKNMVQLAVQGLKESIAGAFGTATQEYKKYVSFTQWLGKLIVNSAEYVGSTTNYIAERFYKRMEDLIFNFRIKLKSLEQVEEDIFDDVPPEAEHFILNSILDE